MRTSFLAALASLALTGCIATAERFETQEVRGPARVEMETVLAHAEQFDTEVADRPAGSQNEQIAASYITGTLQQNGYLVRLESVPVGDLVRSSTLIGAPAGATEPDVAVIVPYGSGPGRPGNGIEVGLFIELSRALTVEEPRHTVYFIAVGADFGAPQGEALGSRSLARFMTDQGWNPLVLQLVDVIDGAPLSVSGDRSDELVDAMTAMTGPFTAYDDGDVEVDQDVFEAAGFDRMLVTGDPEKLGEVLLDYLRRFTSE